jgi:hypothetical protein
MQTITRVINPKVNRIYRGTERRDTVKYKGKLLKGYVKLVKQNGKQTTTTCFFNKKEGRLEEVEGYNWYWLCRKNCLTLKVDNAPKPQYIYHAGDFTQDQIIEKVKQGELDPETGAKLLEAA